MDIGDYFRAWRAHWVTIAVCVVLAVLAAGAVSALAQPKYVATARLFVSTTGGGSISDAYQGSLFSTGRVASYAGLAVGKQVAERAIDELGLNVAPEDVMSRVTATAVPGSVLLDVTVSADDAAAAQDLANAVASQTSSLVQELENADVGGGPSATATVADSADLPGAPSTPQWGRNLVFGLFGGLILGLVTAVARSVLDSTVRTDADIAEGAGAPVLGSIPPVRSMRAGVPLFDPAKPGATESFREIRTAILAMGADLPHGTLVVSSPTAATGSSSVATGLSLALAETGRSVVLIDADLTAGKLLSTFGIGDVPGLGELLRGAVKLDDVVTPTDVDNLCVVGTGKPTPTSSALFGSVSMSNMIKQLHDYFEFVIIDGPPVLASADTAVLAGAVDGVVLVVAPGSSTEDELARTAGKLSLARATILGCVSNTRPKRRVFANGVQ